ncbi:hypothetical protein CAPTEDRAFT_194409, partial [Capitella teleta]
MKAILLIVLLHSAITEQSEEAVNRPITEQSEEAVDRPVNWLDVQVSAMRDRLTAMENQISAVRDRMSVIERNIESICSSMTSFTDFQFQLRNQDASMEEQLKEIRWMVESAVDRLSATEERIAVSDTATEDRLASIHTILNDNMIHFTSRLSTQMEDLDNRTR